MPEINDAKLHDLFDGLDGTPEKESTSLDKWLESANIFPGTMKVPATKLHTIYVLWHTQHIGTTEKPLALRIFGQAMVRKFKRGRNTAGAFYYISRTKNPKIPAYLKT